MGRCGNRGASSCPPSGTRTYSLWSYSVARASSVGRSSGSGREGIGASCGSRGWTRLLESPPIPASQRGAHFVGGPVELQDSLLRVLVQAHPLVGENELGKLRVE